MRWSTVGAEAVLRRVVASLLGMILLSYEALVHDGDARWPILWAGLALTFGPSVLGLLPGRLGELVDPPPVTDPPQSPAAKAGDPS